MGAGGVLLKDVFYPNNDGGPMAETGIHVCAMVSLISALRYHFQGQDVYVIGNILVYPVEGDPSVCRAPDVMVIKGVPSQPERRSFFTWVENAVPNCVIELTSKESKDEDQGPKQEFYRDMGVGEYFLFDPEGDWLPVPLIGYRLVPLADNGNGQGGNGDPRATPLNYVYDELQPFADGSLFSNELGLLLRPEGKRLLLVDRHTDKAIPTPDDLYQQVEGLVLANQQLQRDLDLQQRRADELARTRDEEKRRADDLARTRDEEKQRADELARARDDEKRRADDEKRRADELVRTRDEEKRRADDEKRRADDLARARDDEKRRADELERELARLRAQLPPDPPPA